MRLDTTLFNGRRSVCELISGAEHKIPTEAVWELPLAPYEVSWLRAGGVAPER